MADLTAIILTYNEQLHIARAIRSLKRCNLVEKIYVVDSHSTDDTRLIAENLGAEVVEHDFINQAKQFQWALDSLPIETSWIMRIDADEIVSDSLADELSRGIEAAPLSLGGFTFNRRHIFLGRWIKHGGRYPLRLLRVWRTNRGRVEDRWMDEHIALESGAIHNLKGKFEDRNLNGLDFFTEKHNKYASREALEILRTKYGPQSSHVAKLVLSKQARVKRLVKENVYNRLPYQFTSLVYFLFRYFIQLGWMDGPQGLIYHFLQGFWYRFLVGAKTEEFETILRNLPNSALRIEMLAEFASGLSGNSSDEHHLPNKEIR